MYRKILSSLILALLFLVINQNIIANNKHRNHRRAYVPPRTAGKSYNQWEWSKHTISWGKAMEYFPQQYVVSLSALEAKGYTPIYYSSVMITAYDGTDNICNTGSADGLTASILSSKNSFGLAGSDSYFPLGTIAYSPAIGTVKVFDDHGGAMDQDARKGKVHIDNRVATHSQGLKFGAPKSWVVALVPPRRLFPSADRSFFLRLHPYIASLRNKDNFGQKTNELGDTLAKREQPVTTPKKNVQLKHSETRNTKQSSIQYAKATQQRPNQDQDVVMSVLMR